MPPPNPPVFQVHLHSDLLKALAKQVSSAQNFLITGIGNLIDDCDDIAAGICTDSNLAFQLLLRLNDALHSTGMPCPSGVPLGRAERSGVTRQAWLRRVKFLLKFRSWRRLCW